MEGGGVGVSEEGGRKGRDEGGIEDVVEGGAFI